MRNLRAAIRQKGGRYAICQNAGDIDRAAITTFHLKVEIENER